MISSIALDYFLRLVQQDHVSVKLNRLVRLAAETAKLPMAWVALILPKRIAFIAAHGSYISGYDNPPSFEEAGYSPDSIAYVADTLSHPGFRGAGFVTKEPFVRAFVRIPIKQSSLPLHISLVVANRSALPTNFGQSQAEQDSINVLRAIAETISTEIEVLVAVVAASIQNKLRSENSNLNLFNKPNYVIVNDAVPSQMPDKVHLTPSAPVGGASGERVTNASSRNSRLAFQESPDKYGNETFASFAPECKKLSTVRNPTARDKADSSGSVPAKAAARKIRSKAASEKLQETSVDTLAFETEVDEISDFLEEMGWSAKQSEMTRPIQMSSAAEPTQNFLMKTLVNRSTIRGRNGISYLTMRAWRKPIKEYQIIALRSLKPAESNCFVDAIVDEMSAVVEQFIGMSGFKTVVPVPCGSSGNNCLSLRIAKALAAKHGLKMVEAFEPIIASGSSHPKKNVTRPPMKLVRPVTDAVLLVDDVATSGQHLEEATKLLRQHTNTVFSVAWIGGDSNEKAQEEA